MMRFIALIAVLIIGHSSFAQKRSERAFVGMKMDKKHREWAFPDPKVFAPGGWQGGAGLNYSLNWEETTVEDYTLTPGYGLPGLDLEFGRYFNTGRGFPIHFIDYSIGYRSLRGRHNFESQLDSEVSGTNRYTDRYANADINLNNIICFNDISFLVNSVGVNVDYAFTRTFSVDPNYSLETLQPAAFQSQVHYRLGFGYTMDTDKVLLFTLETPVFNITPTYEDVNSRLVYFNRPFRAVTFKVSMLFFRLGKQDCPTIDDPALPPGFKNGYGG